MEKHVLKIVSQSILPKYQTPGSAGFDLYCNNQETIIAKPHQLVKVPTGLRMQIPEGYFGAIYPRSSAGIKMRVKLANSTGIIDSDYRGEVILFLINEGEKDLEIKKGDRLVQMIIQPYLRVEIEEVDDLDQTDRGEGGLGSTGR
ncbi:MAG: dUTP diphosphatase [Tissierellia bacterium]|nr:dUTP diphosphatase [Tissierellia bacterium]